MVYDRKKDAERGLGKRNFRKYYDGLPPKKPTKKTRPDERVFSVFLKRFNKRFNP